MNDRVTVSLKNVSIYIKRCVRNHTTVKEAVTQSGFTGKTIFICLFISNSAFSGNPDNYTIVPISSLNLNRMATKLNPGQLATYDPAYMGFIWNDPDNVTPEWRPQGITGMEVDSKKFIIVSWYDFDPGNRGSRISFVDITDLDNIKYRHVYFRGNSCRWLVCRWKYFICT
jgi:hypothetical protein